MIFFKSKEVWGCFSSVCIYVFNFTVLLCTSTDLKVENNFL